MSLAAVSFEDLLADFDLTAAKWKVPTDIAGSENVAGLVRHIYVAAMRNSERLEGDPVTEFGAAKNHDAAWELQSRTAASLRRFLDEADDATLDEIRHIQWRTAGELTVTRRKLCLHIFVHAIRHWSQIGPLVRQSRFPVGWPQDILFSGAIR